MVLFPGSSKEKLPAEDDSWIASALSHVGCARIGTSPSWPKELARAAQELAAAEQVASGLPSTQKMLQTAAARLRVLLLASVAWNFFLRGIGVQVGDNTSMDPEQLASLLARSCWLARRTTWLWKRLSLLPRYPSLCEESVIPPCRTGFRKRSRAWS